MVLRHPRAGDQGIDRLEQRVEIGSARPRLHVSSARFVIGEHRGVAVRDERVRDGLTGDSDAVHEHAHQSATPRLMKSA